MYVEGQAVLVQARKCTQEGFVTDTYENKFNLPEDVDVSRYLCLKTILSEIFWGNCTDK